MDEVFKQAETKMKAAVEHLGDEFKTLRTGRANASILDQVSVDYYGTPTPLKQVANLTVADASLLVAQPFDPSSIEAIEKGIMQADLGLNPSNDGKVIRIPVPPLTEERRKTLVKLAHDMAESSKNSIRHARREGNDALKALEKEKEISQDDEKRGHDEIQKLHDVYIGQITEALKAKESDILEV